MKPITLVSVAVLALPGVRGAAVRRQSPEATADELLFNVSLQTFIARRDARDPPSVIWTSNGCSYSPDNPLGFPFEPACYRHDFGYHNYIAQDRFSDANKLRVDNKFRDDLYGQCHSTRLEVVCKALADVYYAAVRVFGGIVGTGRQSSDAVVSDEAATLYREKVAAYEQAVKDAREQGLLPPLE